MLEVDDSELGEDEREFLQRWADALQVPVEVLIIRILSAAVDGDQYIQSRPVRPNALNNLRTVRVVSRRDVSRLWCAATNSPRYFTR